MRKTHIKILLIEDNPGDARLMQEALTAARVATFDIECKDLLSKALPSVSKGGHDLILLDLSLPDSQGLETFRIIQKHALGKPVIVLTGLYDEEIAVKAVHEGAQDYLVKGQVDANLLYRSIFYAIERQRIEEELRISNDLNLSIIKALPFGMDIVNEKGQILYLSDKFQQLFGKEAIGEKCWLIYKDDKQQCHNCSLKSGIKIGEVHSIETEGIKGGKIFQIMHIGIIYKGQKAILEIFNDITERRRIEQMKSDFVALVSHQLKTPVGEIRGYVDNMLAGLTGEPTEKQKRYLQEMKTISGRAYRLIADLLNVSRIERGVMSMCLHEVELSEIVDAALFEYREVIAQKGLTLHYEGAKQKIVVVADRDKFIEALSNVINNCVRFTDQGSLTLRMYKDASFGYLEVQDTGKGIAPEVLPVLFTKEQTLSGSPTPEGGAGLGLYITKSFMTLQLGDVWAESTLGEGSKFIFKIPLPMV
jgi:two-component system sensor histidine kinase/response regulator